MKTFVCNVCGHIAFNHAPVDCPVCQMAIENFEKVPEAIKSPADPENLTDSEKKHIPDIVVNRECSLLPDSGCIDLHVKVGETEHVMESEHYIAYVDLYLNKHYISRFIMTSKVMHPVASFHLNTSEGKLRAVANCNVHGNWMSEITLTKTEE